MPPPALSIMSRNPAGGQSSRNEVNRRLKRGLIADHFGVQGIVTMACKPSPLLYVGLEFVSLVHPWYGSVYRHNNRLAVHMIFLTPGLSFSQNERACNEHDKERRDPYMPSICL